MSLSYPKFKEIYELGVEQGHIQGEGVDRAWDALKAYRCYLSRQARSEAAQEEPAAKEPEFDDEGLPPYNPPDRSIEELALDSPEDEIAFGKHKGATFEEISEEDPGYIVWLSENVDTISLPDFFVERCKRNT